jgi:hypothetical protein
MSAMAKVFEGISSMPESLVPSADGDHGLVGAIWFVEAW